MKAELLNSVAVAPDIRQFQFAVPELAALKFLPGQFVSLSGTFGEKKVTRAYSIASLPDGSNTFSICLNRVDDGIFSPHLYALQPGETVDMKGPLGVFVWKPERADSVMVATGTGIVPYRPMLIEALRQGATEKFTLIYGTRHPENLLYVDEFNALAAQHPNFTFIPQRSARWETSLFVRSTAGISPWSRRIASICCYAFCVASGRPAKRDCKIESCSASQRPSPCCISQHSRMETRRCINCA